MDVWNADLTGQVESHIGWDSFTCPNHVQVEGDEGIGVHAEPRLGDLVRERLVVVEVQDQRASGHAVPLLVADDHGTIRRGPLGAIAPGHRVEVERGQSPASLGKGRRAAVVRGADKIDRVADAVVVVGLVAGARAPQLIQPDGAGLLGVASVDPVFLLQTKAHPVPFRRAEFAVVDENLGDFTVPVLNRMILTAADREPGCTILGVENRVARGETLRHAVDVEIERGAVDTMRGDEWRAHGRHLVCRSPNIDGHTVAVNVGVP